MTKTAKLLRHTTSKSEMMDMYVLELVQKYVDPRAHFYRGELRYSIQNQKGHWCHARPLDKKEVERIFMGLNPM